MGPLHILGFNPRHLCKVLALIRMLERLHQWEECASLTFRAGVGPSTHAVIGRTLSCCWRRPIAF